jgi:hypothetical protein
MKRVLKCKLEGAIADEVERIVILSDNRSMNVEAFAHMLRLSLSMTPMRVESKLILLNFIL